MTLKRVVCVTLVAAAANLSQDVCGFGVNHRHIQRSAAHSSSTTAMHAEPTASEKAAELRKKAEEAKRKAEELRKVAEEKAAKAMMAVKEAQSKSNNNGTTAAPITTRPPTPPPVKRVDTPITVAKAASNVGSDPRDGAIVPINQANIEFTAGVLAGGVALALGATPVFAVVAAAVANYISKKADLGEVNEFVNGIATASLSTLNWFGKLDSKYLLLGKLSDQLDAQINKLKNSEGESAENIRKIEESLAKTSRQIKQLGEEIDFIEGSKQALGAVGEVIETSVDKAFDANKEYKLTERAANAAKKAVEKAKSQE
ncbi:hypothetical protein ACHAWC_007225 [Mediolabrus comicus]